MLLPHHCQHSKSSPASSSLLDLSSDLLQHHLLHISSVVASQKQATVELGNNKNMGQREKVASWKSLFSLQTKIRSTHSSLVLFNIFQSCSIDSPMTCMKG